MRLIDADALIPLIQEDKIEGKMLDIIKALGDGLQAETLNQACDRHIKIISSLPTIDAVPIVRCTDCKHSAREQIGYSCEMNYRLATNGKFYCSDGEREEE